MNLDRPPAPWARQQRWIVVLATVAMTLTRIWGRAASAWDWDELLFLHALRSFDVPSHHPHPPGFPLFILPAKALTLAGIDPFLSLQLINIVAGAALVPAMVAFARELRFPPQTSIMAGLILAFLPNVWFFGEGGFSDVPAVVLVLLACAALLAGCRNPRMYLLGAIILGVSAGLRPQNLLVGFLPAILATYYQFRARRIGTILVGVVLGILIVGSTYGGAAIASGGWRSYFDSVRAHQQYITTVDSFRNPNRPSLLALADNFFIRPYDAPVITSLLTALAIVSVVTAISRRRLPVILALGTFGPFAITAWLILDHFSTSRFSIGYIPLIALLAADGLAVVALAAGRFKIDPPVAEAVAASALVLLLVVWSAPAIYRARSTLSPPMQAMEWIKKHVSASEATLFVHGSVQPYADYFLTQYRRVPVEVPPLAASPNTWYLTEGLSGLRSGNVFTWERSRLWRIARRRYFEVSVVPVASIAEFRNGWYDEESDGTTAWRWMGHQSLTMLPPIDGRARLRLRLFCPIHAIDGTPTVQVRLNGVLIDEFQLTEPYHAASYVVTTSAGAPSELLITTSRVVNPSKNQIGTDPRDLGLRLDGLDWVPVQR